MLNPSASVGRVSTATGWPAATAAVKLAARSGSTPRIFTFGFNVFSASAIPATKPAPPMGTMTASTSGTCAAISSPKVPCPAMIVGSS